MASIVKRRGKDGRLSYQVRVRVRGRNQSSATFRRLTDARAYALQVDAQIAEGRYFPHAEARRHTVAEAIDRYLLHVLPHKKPQTARQNRQQLMWWRSHIGEVRLSHLSAGIIVEHRERLAREHSPATANRYTSVLKHLLHVCIRDWSWLSESPIRNLVQLREPSGRMRYLEVPERERLLEACQASTHRYLYPVVVLALCTGCRKGEILGLEWSRVDPGCTHITLVDTKNSDTRRLPIVEPALSVFRAHAKVRALGCDWVFPGKAGGPCDIGKAWQIAVKTAGLDDFRFHDLRHTTASYLAMSGASTVEIAEILGHRNLDMVRRYAHLSESSVSETLSRAMTQFLG